MAWDTAELVGRIYPDYTAPSDVDEKYAGLAALGYGQVQDPDGNHVDLFPPL